MVASLSDLLLQLDCFAYSHCPACEESGPYHVKPAVVACHFHRVAKQTTHPIFGCEGNFTEGLEEMMGSL